MHRPPYNCGRGFDTAVFVRGQEYDPWITGDIEVDVTEFHRMRGDETDEVFGPRFVQYLKNRTAFKTEEDHCAPRVIKEAVHWLDHVTETAMDNLFLWVDSFSPHEPWDPPEPFRSMYDPGYTGQELIDPVPGDIEGYMTDDERAHTKALYGGCVTLVDKWVGILLDRIRELGLYDNSIIMFTSDHGEPFGEHGYIRKCRHFCYDYLAHIPWIVRMPGAEPGRNSSFVQPPDLMPTALDALGFDFSGTVRSDWAIDGNPNLRTELTGTSILPVITGEKEQVRDCAVSAFHGRHWSIRTEEWTLLKNLQGEKEKLLFNRSDDPAEKNNLVDSQPEVAQELEEKLDTFADRMHTRTSGKD